jgi:hypothetical protein
VDHNKGVIEMKSEQDIQREVETARGRSDDREIDRLDEENTAEMWWHVSDEQRERSEEQVWKYLQGKEYPLASIVAALTAGAMDSEHKDFNQYVAERDDKYMGLWLVETAINFLVHMYEEGELS